ncbi:MAG TPA: sugar ABC transporter permease [Stellaceae bacterium]|nr:sugar ABC transporter permease [Stellaceae bacterium]
MGTMAFGRSGASTAGWTRRRARFAGTAHWLLVPALAFTLALVVFPFGYTFWLSLNDYQFGHSARFNFGENYAALLHDAVFWQGLGTTFFLYFLSLALQLVLGTYVGLLLNRRLYGQTLARTILMSPFMMPSVVIGMMWLVILDPSLGAANYILGLLGLPPSQWLASPGLVVPVIALIDTWQWTPFVALIIVGGLQALPIEPFEAAFIDGATRWQAFRYVTLPMLRPTLLTAAILRSVDLLRFFDIIYITTQGGPGNASTTLNIYAYRRGFEFFDIGYASAIMIALMALVAIVVLALMRLRRSL